MYMNFKFCSCEKYFPEHCATFFKHNVWNVLVGTIKRGKNLQLQRTSRVCQLCLQNTALTGVQKATENSLCGCLIIYLFKLKIVRLFTPGQAVKFILSLE